MTGATITDATDRQKVRILNELASLPDRERTGPTALNTQAVRLGPRIGVPLGVIRDVAHAHGWPNSNSMGRAADIIQAQLERAGSGGDTVRIVTSATVTAAMRTLTTAGHQSLVTPGDLAAAEAQVDDCLFRMLEPAETAAGMAFPDNYQWQGTRRERQKLAGNAVTPPAARDLIGCAVEALTGEAA